jgi:hypothetical protein
MRKSNFTGLYMHRLIECLESFVKHIELLECMCGTVCEIHEHRLCDAPPLA